MELLHVGPEHGRESVDDYVGRSVVVDSCDASEADDGLKLDV